MIPPAVLAAYPPEVRDCTWVPLPSGGGMSGGQVWRGDVQGEPRFALKRWPRTWLAIRLRAVQARMTRVEHLGFVPQLIRTTSDGTLTVHDFHCWDATDWRLGTPHLLSHAALGWCRSAATTLAHLHRTWLRSNPSTTTCSAIARRLKLLAQWENARFRFDGAPDEVAEVGRTVSVVHDTLATTRQELRLLSNLRRPVAAIHGDYWPENVLFQHDRLTAVLDYGNVGFDHPEVDLGRLFADVPGADRPMIAEAVAAYNAVAPFDLSVPLVEVLASTGRLCSLANWHLRLNAGSPDAGLLSAALPRIRRLAALVVAG